MSQLRTVLDISHSPRPNSIPKLQILHALDVPSLYLVARELLADEVQWFCAEDWCEPFQIFPNRRQQRASIRNWPYRRDGPRTESQELLLQADSGGLWQQHLIGRI